MAGAAVLALVLYWYGATSEVAWLFLLAAWMIAAIVIAGVYTWWNLRGLTLHLQVTSSDAAEGSPSEELPEQLLRTAPSPGPIFERDSPVVEVGLNTTSAARGPAQISGLLGGDSRTLGTGTVPRRGWRRSVALESIRRGALTASSWTITATDALGFFRAEKRCPDREVALVFPLFASLSGRRQVRELEASVSSPRAGSGTELFGIREYRSGDSLRRIHWRSTARRGELVVREYEPPGARMLGICVDPSPPSRDAADQICRIAASEAWDCIRDGGRVVLWAPDLEPTSITRDLWTVLEWLARFPDLRSGPSGTVPTPSARWVPSRYGEEIVLVASRQVDVAATRAWIVGDAPFELDIPSVRVGLQWPL